MTVVYVVTAYVEHETAEAVRAFRTRKDAEAFAEQCRAYNEAQPLSPGLNATDAEWDAYEPVLNDWKAKHPAGDDGIYADGFYVRDVPFGKAS